MWAFLFNAFVQTIAKCREYKQGLMSAVLGVAVFSSIQSTVRHLDVLQTKTEDCILFLRVFLFSLGLDLHLLPYRGPQ